MSAIADQDKIGASKTLASSEKSQPYKQNQGKNITLTEEDHLRLQTNISNLTNTSNNMFLAVDTKSPVVVLLPLIIDPSHQFYQHFKAEHKNIHDNAIAKRKNQNIKVQNQDFVPQLDKNIGMYQKHNNLNGGGRTNRNHGGGNMLFTKQSIRLNKDLHQSLSINQQPSTPIKQQRYHEQEVKDHNMQKILEGQQQTLKHQVSIKRVKKNSSNVLRSPQPIFENDSQISKDRENFDLGQNFLSSLKPYNQDVGQDYIQSKQQLIQSNSKKQIIKVNVPKKIIIQNKDSLSRFIKDFEENYASGGVIYAQSKVIRKVTKKLSSTHDVNPIELAEMLSPYSNMEGNVEVDNPFYSGLMLQRKSIDCGGNSFRRDSLNDGPNRSVIENKQTGSGNPFKQEKGQMMDNKRSRKTPLLGTITPSNLTQPTMMQPLIFSEQAAQQIIASELSLSSPKKQILTERKPQMDTTQTNMRKQLKKRLNEIHRQNLLNNYPPQINNDEPETDFLNKTQIDFQGGPSPSNNMRKMHTSKTKLPSLNAKQTPNSEKNSDFIQSVPLKKKEIKRSPALEQSPSPIAQHLIQANVRVVMSRSSRGGQQAQSFNQPKIVKILESPMKQASQNEVFVTQVMRNMNEWQLKFDEMSDTLKAVKKKQMRIGKRNNGQYMEFQDSATAEKSVKFRLPSIMEMTQQ